MTEYLGEQPSDWRPDFERKSREPYGCYIAYDMIQEMYNDFMIEECEVTTYQWFNSEYRPDDQYNMIIITDEMDVKGVELEYLDSIVKAGNNVFIAATHFGREMEKELDFDFIYYNPFYYFNNDTTRLRLTNKQLNDSAYYPFAHSVTNSYFTTSDTLRTTCLGTNQENDACFIRISRGKGNFFLHSQPFAFTNINLLDSNNFRYVQKNFSYLPNENVLVWNEFYKPFKLVGSQSVLKVLNYFEPLRYATYLMIVLVIIYFVFGSKRKQSLIPIVKAPANTSLEFIDTVSRAYLYDRNHKKMAKTRFNYFLDHVKTHYLMDTSRTGDEFNRVLSEKSGVDPKLIGSIFGQERSMRERIQISVEQLTRFSKTIEEFYKKSR